MLERLRLKCPSKGHHLVMKVIANWFFFFQINFFPYHPGNHQPSHYGPSSVSCCNLCFFTIFHSLTMTVWQILRSFYVSHFKCRLYWRRWTRHRHTSQDNVSFSSFSIILFSFAKIQNRWTCQEKKNCFNSAITSSPCSSVPVAGHKDWTILTLSNQVVTLYHLHLTALSSHK